MGSNAINVMDPLDSGQNFMNRLHARLSVVRSGVTGFVWQPEPRTIGSYARGKQLIVGNFRFGGHLTQAPHTPIWDITPPDRFFDAELHSFVWLDDLAMVNDATSRKLAQAWLGDWIDRYMPGSGPGWTPDLTGRRLIRWINHAMFLMNALPTDLSRRYFDALGRHAVFLSRRWSATAPGLPRFEALTGMLYAGLSLEGMEHLLTPAMNALARECDDQINDQGGLPTRNPDDLLEVLTLLNWAAESLRARDKAPLAPHLAAIDRAATALRALRHSNGALARFHGGCGGLDGQLERTLADANVKPRRLGGLAMGYARMAAGSSSLIMDASAPPARAASLNAHASTLAFELTSGGMPVIVNCGSGRHFGDEWQRAARATQSHSTLSIDNVPSAKLSETSQGDILIDGPGSVTCQMSSNEEGTRLVSCHNSYLEDYGLLHERRLHLSRDGRVLNGEDILGAFAKADQRQFDNYMTETALRGVHYAIRFHIHPAVDAQVDLRGKAVSLYMKGGETWVFRAEPTAKLSLEASVYLEKTRLKPRATKQIVLSARVMEYANQVSWSLTRAQQAPARLRDGDQTFQAGID